MSSPLRPLLALTLPLISPLVDAEITSTLPAVIVTANRIVEPETDALAAVTVITRADIERQQARHVADVLRGLPGISLAQNGGDGQPLSLFVRGTNADHVLVLIDGVKVGSATLGTVPLHHLPLAQIERIEIVRGPRSSLYGSEAIGGVIQIFTQRGGGAVTPSASLTTGSFDTHALAASVSGGGERGWFHLGTNWERTGGINGCDGAADSFAGCGVTQPDRDGYRSGGINLRAGYAVNPALVLDAHLSHADNRTAFDGSTFAGTDSRTAQQVAGATVTLTPLDWWTALVSVGHSWDRYRSFFADTGGEEALVSHYDTERASASFQNTFTLAPAHQFTVGVDYLTDHVTSQINYARDSRDNRGVFSAYHGQFAAVAVTLSARHDDNQQFGGHATGNAALGYQFANGIHVDLSYGTAFKAPSFNDLYYPNYGNPALTPEQARSWELGMSGALPIGDAAAGRWETRLFRTDIDDLIVYDSASWSAANLSSARITGVETSATARLFDLDLRASVTLLQPEQRENGNLLPRRPEQTAQLDADHQFGRWSIGATLFAAGRRFDDVANTTRLDEYALLHLRTEYALTKTWRVQARLDNALDADYETAYLFNQPGRAVYLTVRYAPGDVNE